MLPTVLLIMLDVERVTDKLNETGYTHRANLFAATVIDLRK